MINSDSIFKSYTDEATFSKIVDYGCVSEMWAHSVATYPDNVAIVDGREVTFRQMNEEVAALRGVLADKGIKSGDNVGIYCPNSLAFVKAYLAAATLGACAVLMPPHLDMPTVFGCTMKFALNAIVYDESLSGNLTRLFLRTILQRALLCYLSLFFGCFTGTRSPFGRISASGFLAAASRMFSFSMWV